MTSKKLEKVTKTGVKKSEKVTKNGLKNWKKSRKLLEISGKSVILQREITRKSHYAEA